MAKRKARGKRAKKRGGIKKALALLLALCAALFLLCGYVRARVVRVAYSDAYIQNLSPFLDGVTVLYATDFKIEDQRGAHRTANLLKELMALNPDIVLLGGDFTGMSFWDLFRAQTESGRASIQSRLADARAVFFTEISALYPPYGVYAVAGDEDSQTPGLLNDCFSSGVLLLENQTEKVMINGAPLYIVGLADFLTSGNRTAYRFTGPSLSDPVLVLSHNPDAYARVSSVTDGQGNPLADLIFAGHTLGGQMRAFGQGLLSRAGVYNGRFLQGVYNETGPNMLVSSGVGAQWLPLRFGTRAEVHMVTLRRK